MKRLFFSFFFFFVITYLGFSNGIAPLLNQTFERVFHKEIESGHHDELKGFFYVIADNLMKIESSRWPEQIARWQPFFGFKIKLLSLDAVDFKPEEIETLVQGVTVLRGDSDISDNIYYQRIGKSASVLQFGPIAPKEEPIWKTIRKIVLGAMIFAVIVLTLMWFYPFRRKLRRIRLAAGAFGRGDLDIRVDMSRRSALFPVANAFNQMAARIQQLIDSHRELTRAVSHELRTPMARVRFHLEMFADSKDAADRKRHRNGMRKDIGELDALIMELATYARFDSRPSRLSAKFYPLVVWLGDIAENMTMELQKREFKLLHPPDLSGLSVYFDPKYMERAVSNLLSNAVKYGRSRVELTVERKEDEVLLHIDDDGPGIPVQDHLRIFAPFARLDKSRSRDSGGFGLGLAIVKRIIEWHGGSVSVGNSRLGGARFSLKWPVCKKTPKT